MTPLTHLRTPLHLTTRESICIIGLWALCSTQPIALEEVEIALCDYHHDQRTITALAAMVLVNTSLIHHWLLALSLAFKRGDFFPAGLISDYMKHNQLFSLLPANVPPYLLKL